MKALIFDGKIVDVAEKEFEVASGMSWIDCPDDCKAGKWTLVDSVPTEPDPNPEPTYKDKRKREYPSIEECVHAILDDELDSLQIKRQAVKNKYPKPEVGGRY